MVLDRPVRSVMQADVLAVDVGAPLSEVKRILDDASVPPRASGRGRPSHRDPVHAGPGSPEPGALGRRLCDARRVARRDHDGPPGHDAAARGACTPTTGSAAPPSCWRTGTSTPCRWWTRERRLAGHRHQHRPTCACSTRKSGSSRTSQGSPGNNRSESSLRLACECMEDDQGHSHAIPRKDDAAIARQTQPNSSDVSRRALSARRGPTTRPPCTKPSSPTTTPA